MLQYLDNTIRPGIQVVRFGSSLGLYSVRVCVVFESVRFGSNSGCVIFFYFEYRHHFSQINVGSDRFGLGLFGFGSDSSHLIWGSVRI